MEKERSSKVLAIVALLVAVVGLSVGFAAYTATLKISSSATVTPTEDFDVYFSTSGTTQTTGDVTPVVKANDVEVTTTTAGNPKADAATLSDTTISGLKAYFTEPGQTVTYSFYAHNASDYVAYLNQVVFAEVESGKTKVCTAKTESTIGVDAACNDITITVEVDDDTYPTTDTNVSGHTLIKNGYEPVVVTISYADNGNRANGDFDVAFGDITLTYNEVE